MMRVTLPQTLHKLSRRHHASEREPAGRDRENVWPDMPSPRAKPRPAPNLGREPEAWAVQGEKGALDLARVDRHGGLALEHLALGGAVGGGVGEGLFVDPNVDRALRKVANIQRHSCQGCGLKNHISKV